MQRMDAGQVTPIPLIPRGSAAQQAPVKLRTVGASGVTSSVQAQDTLPRL